MVVKSKTQCVVRPRWALMPPTTMTRPPASARALLPTTARSLKRSARTLHLIAPTRALDTSTGTPLSTVNASEIAHFSRLSAQWWDEGGEFGLLHRMNPHRVRYVREKILETGREENGEAWADGRGARVLEGMDVLDIGCGGGILSEVRITCIYASYSPKCHF